MTAKIRGPQVDAGTGADQLVQLDGSGNLPVVDGSALTGIPTLSGANTFAGLQTITHTGDVGLIIWDTDGGNDSTLSFKPAGSNNSSTTLINSNAGGSEQFVIARKTSGGASASVIRLYEDGETTLANGVNLSSISISAAGAITLNSATGQRITFSDEGRFFTTATFTSHSTIAGTSIDWRIGNKLTCSASGTLSFINPPAPASLVLKLTAQPNLPAAVRWPDGGAEPAKTGVTIVGLYFDGSTYYAMQGTNFL